MGNLRSGYLSSYSALIFLLLWGAQATASSCCGGGGDLPGLITGDLKRKISIDSSFANVIAYASSDSKYYFSDSSWEKRKHILKVSYAQFISDKWQMSLAIPYVKNIFNADTKSGLGDLSIGTAYTLAYEGFTWKEPQTLLFVSVNFPTGNSIYSSGENEYYLDVMGNGTEVLSLGLAMTKSFSFGMLNTNLALQQKYSHESSGKNISYDPGVMFQLSLGKAFKSLKNWAWSTSYSYSLDGKKTISSLETSENRSFSLGAGLSYSLNEILVWH